MEYLRKVFDVHFDELYLRESSPVDNSAEDPRVQPWLQGPEGTIHTLNFFPSAEGIEKLRKDDLSFPQACCVCGNSIATDTLPIHPGSWIHRLANWIRGKRPLLVPHCKEHLNRRYALFSARIEDRNNQLIRCFCVGYNKSFLESILSQYTIGDYPPPWVFNQHGFYSGSGWSQGIGESWLDTTWRPFWRSLSEEERVEYLDRWEADEFAREAFLGEEGHWRVWSRVGPEWD